VIPHGVPHFSYFGAALGNPGQIFSGSTNPERHAALKPSATLAALTAKTNPACVAECCMSSMAVKNSGHHSSLEGSGEPSLLRASHGESRGAAHSSTRISRALLRVGERGDQALRLLAVASPATEYLRGRARRDGEARRAAQTSQKGRYSLRWAWLIAHML
jgi:hypothetical protein